MPLLFLLKGILLFAVCFLIFASLFTWAFAESYPLCVGDDCSYTWQIETENFEEMRNFYVAEPHGVLGFTEYHEKKVIVSDIKYIPHEWRHVKCQLEYQGIERALCHERVDREIWWN